jgi:simple sugar transport system permease protein
LRQGKFLKVYDIVFSILPIVAALAFTTLILLASDAPPLQAYLQILTGAFENANKWSDVATAWVPLVLCSAGLLVTFAAGQWNIGIEGQIVLGAVFTTWVVRTVSSAEASFLATRGVLLVLLLLAGAAGGALWAMLAGALKVYGHVHEIFGGMGLNFVAAALVNYLIFDPWKPPDGATMSGTDPFPAVATLPRLGALRVTPLSVFLAVLAIVAVAVILRGTSWGLKLKAIGRNARAAFLMGVPADRDALLSYAVCGALAGLAGAIQASGVYRRLIPQISGGYGSLSLLVVLLSGFQAGWVPLVAFFFAAIGVGSPRLELRLGLDSSLGGVLETAIVLFFLLVQGARQRLERARVELAQIPQKAVHPQPVEPLHRMATDE